MELKKIQKSMQIFTPSSTSVCKRFQNESTSQVWPLRDPKGLDFYLKEWTIDDDPIINNKQWSLHHAQLLKHPNPMSVFIGKEDSSSLEKFAKVKYIWHLNVEVNFQL